jgi:hypothetical protein
MITWEVDIKIINVARKEVSVTATRTDDSTTPEGIRTYRIPGAVIQTAAQKTAVMDRIWAKHQDALSQESAAATVIGTLETQAKNNLEARE